VKYLRVDHVLRIHERVVERSGGAPGVLNPDAVDSAVAQPQMAFGGQDLYPTLAEKAAALAYSLNMNHPFQDGNKRTAHAAMEMFLLRNGHEIEASVEEQERVFLAVAAGEMDREAFAAWVRGAMIGRRT
jgi:death on curing protein